MTVTGMPPAAVRLEFGRRLQRLLNERGWTQAELARRVAQLLPDMRVGRDNISKYVRGLVLPLPPMLAAICKVLEVEPTDLLPSRATRATVEEHAPIGLRDLGDGRAWLEIHVSQELPWSIALKVIGLLKRGRAAPPSLSPHQASPHAGRGRLQVQIRRAFMACGDELTSSQVYSWTYPRGGRRHFYSVWRVLSELAEPIGRASTIGRPYVWRLKSFPDVSQR